ncbi:MAG: hypothetical protein ABIH34_07055, partial [Nanoarchaeota archaeon]
ILKYHGDPRYEIMPLDTKVKIGEKLGDEEAESYTMMPYPDLLTRNYIVVSDSSYTWLKGQRCHYRIQKKQINSFAISPQSFILAKLRIQHDANKRRVRLTGQQALAADNLRIDSGIGPWITYDADVPVMSHYTKSAISMTKEQYRNVLRRSKYGVKVDESEYQLIKEIPVMISEEKYVVCIPKKEHECQRIIIVGESGTGKSVFTNGFASRLLWKWQDRAIWMLDPSNQYEDISLPQDYDPFNKVNALINETPRPIPAVQCYLACNKRIRMKHPNVSLLITLNFLEFLNKFKFYTDGIRDWDFGDKHSYLMDFMEEIKDVTTVKELEQIMMDKLSDDKGKISKGLQSMQRKWVSKFSSIFKEKFLTNQHKRNFQATDELEVRFKDGRVVKGHPLIMLAEAGAVPVLNISDAKATRWYRNFLADFIQKVMAHQDELKEKRKRLWLIYDEMNMIYRFGKNQDLAYFAFEESSSQGRYKNMGFIGNTQSIAKVNPDIWEQATQICCFYMKNDKERMRIGKNFEIPKEIYESIGTLKKQEMMIFTNPGINPFIIYDRWGRRKVSDRAYFRGNVLPPPNHHSVAEKPLEVKEDGSDLPKV